MAEAKGNPGSGAGEGGWPVLHLFQRLDRVAWRQLTPGVELVFDPGLMGQPPGQKCEVFSGSADEDDRKVARWVCRDEVNGRRSRSHIFGDHAKRRVKC